MTGRAWERILSAIQSELLEMQRIIKQSLQSLAAHTAEEFGHLVSASLQHTLPSVLVLLSARLFGPPTAPVIALAAVVHFICLAAQAHQSVQEWSGAGDPRQCYQYPVLAGDYLYSHFFNCLCHHGILQYLQPLAQIICEISEGSILRLQNKENASAELLKKVVRKEVAALIGESCHLAARLAGASEEEQEILYRFGLNFGMALGLSNLGLEADAYVEEALAALDKLPFGESREALKELVTLWHQSTRLDLALQVV